MKSIKVIHVCYSDIEGGAGRAANRLHKALKKSEINSLMYVIKKGSNDKTVVQPLGLLGRFFAIIRQAISKKIARFIFNNGAAAFSFNLMSSGLARKINDASPDVVNLHWLGAETIGLNELRDIRCPIVWTMHDMWPISGVEHYRDAGRNVVCTEKAISDLLINKKKTFFKNSSVVLVGPSAWLCEEAKNAKVIDSSRIINIKNCVDQNIFKSYSKSFARSLFSLEDSKKYILFGAINSTSDKRKGFHILTASLAHIFDPDIELLVFGADDGVKEISGFKVNYIGVLQDDYSLAMAYSAANIFVAPSMQDNLPNTVIEAQACGLPCVAFDIGGLPDLISHDVNGYLAAAFCDKSLSDYIKLALANEKRLASCARTTSTSEVTVSNEYINLYDRLCKNINWS